MAAPEPFLSLGFAAVDWIEHFLVHGPGDVQGQPIELDDEFAAFIVKCYAVDKRGERRVRRAFLSRSKGRSKSGLAAMIACFEALGPCRFDHFAEEGEVSDWGYEYEEGEPVGKPLVYAEALNVATEEGQAGNTYDAIHYMLNADTCSAELLAEFGRLDVGLTRINLPNKRGFIEPVTSADTSKDGGKSTFIVADETHLWIVGRLKRLHGIMTRNLLKRKIASGWMLETSTMYAEGESSVAEGTHDYARRAGDKTLLFDHRQAAMKWDLTKKGERVKALREAYGPAAAWMNLDAIAESWDDPQVSEADFRRYWLNQPVPTTAPAPLAIPSWFDRKSIDAPGKPAALGLAMDLDRVWLSLSVSSGTHIGPVISKANGRVLRVRADADKSMLLAEAARISTEHGIPIALDAKGPAATLADDLEALGITTDRGNLLRASFDDYVQACADLYDGVEAGRVTHGDYAELNDAVAAAGWRAGERRVWSRKSGDLSMLEAATLALWGASQPAAESIYESRGLLTL